MKKTSDWSMDVSVKTLCGFTVTMATMTQCWVHSRQSVFREEKDKIKQHRRVANTKSFYAGRIHTYTQQGLLFFFFFSNKMPTEQERKQHLGPNQLSKAWFFRDTSRQGSTGPQWKRKMAAAALGLPNNGQILQNILLTIFTNEPRLSTYPTHKFSANALCL